MLWIHDQLLGICLARGYNTQPLVTMDMDAYRQATTTYALVVECETHNATEHGINQVQMGPEFVIHGNAIVGTGIPRREAFKLEQDVRTAIDTAMVSLRANRGRGFSLRWGNCSHDGGTLSPERQAGFRLYLSLNYPQGSTW
jgi:hypothetical protein